MNLNEAIHRLADFITRLASEEESSRQAAAATGVRHYGIKTDFVSFSDEGLGEVLLKDGDAKEYRRHVDEVYKQSVGKTEHLSRSAVASFIQMAILKVLNPAQDSNEKNLSKRLSTALADLKKELKSKPVNWEAHFPVEILADKLPYLFGKCEFYFGDEECTSSLIQRMCPQNDFHGGDRKQKARQGDTESVKDAVRGKTWVSTLVEPVDPKSPHLLALRRIRQTVDILNFYANLGGQGDCQALLSEDARAVLESNIVFSQESDAREIGSRWVGSFVPFSFASPNFRQAGFERVSAILQKQSLSEFEDRVIKAFQWAGRASVEPRREEAFLLCAISLESLLLRKKGKEVTETLALRLAHLISSPKTRLMVYRDMKRLYDIRSEIVHSGSVDVGEDQLSETRYYTRLSLLSALLSSHL